MNLINNHPNVDKIYLYAKDSYEAKYQYLIKKREQVDLDYYDDPKVEYSNDMQDVYKDIDEYNIDKECKVLIVFNDMIADMINNIKLNSIVTKLFIRSRKLPISLVFITQSYFKVPKDVILNTSHIFITKIPKKENLNKASFKVYKKVTFKVYKKVTYKDHIQSSHKQSPYKVHCICHISPRPS